MNICVIGTGYVGLVTGTCLAEMGNSVICVDINEEKVAQLKQGISPIYEPQLDVLLERNIRQERLTFTTSIQEGVQSSTIIFLALPTPPGEDGSADLSYILDVAKNLGGMINDYKIVIDKSTVPVGTADKVRETILANAGGKEIHFDVVSNPEFLREGFAIEDFMKPERVVIGTDSEKAETILRELYAPFVRQGNPVIFMDIRSAELTKYAANSFLATKISFMNEISVLCEKMGADVDMVRLGIGSDSRIGKRFLFPGVGYGGSCFPKDVKALIKSSDEVNYDFKILKSVTEVNQAQKNRFIDTIIAHFGGNVSGKTFAIWGLAFKPDTDDIREAPALEIITKLLQEGAKVNAFDPEAMENTERIFGTNVNFTKNQYEALQDADALIIVTEWSVFRSPDFEKMKSLLKNPCIFDGRNIFTVQKMAEQGFNYTSIGRGRI